MAVLLLKVGRVRVVFVIPALVVVAVAVAVVAGGEDVPTLAGLL
jgi:sugar phosphate permease